PLEDPHGHPIPTREGTLTQRALQSLDQFREGQRVVIREAQDDNPDRLRRWQVLGLMPGAEVRIRSYQELDERFELEAGDWISSLGSEGLEGLRGELVSG